MLRPWILTYCLNAVSNVSAAAVSPMSMYSLRMERALSSRSCSCIMFVLSQSSNACAASIALSRASSHRMLPCCPVHPDADNINKHENINAACFISKFCLYDIIHCKDSANRVQNAQARLKRYAEMQPILCKVRRIFLYMSESVRVSIGVLYSADNFAATF